MKDLENILAGNSFKHGGHVPPVREFQEGRRFTSVLLFTWWSMQPGDDRECMLFFRIIRQRGC